MRNYLNIGLTGILLCFAGLSQAQVHEFLLDNGLKVLVKEDHRAPIVVSQIWYKVGSSYEHDGITGISHALEHMIFKGTEKYPKGEFSRIISANGGQENAFTGTDYTAYFQTLEKSRLEISLRLEADRMRYLSLPEDEYLKEIKVVQEERRMRTEDNPGAFTREVAMATAFQTSPYRQPIVGWMADLETMKVDDLKRWYQKWYAPNNATLVIAGDVEPAYVHRLAKKYFAGFAAEDIDSPPAGKEVEQLGLKRVLVKRSAEVAQLMMAYKIPVLKSFLKADGAETWEPYALEVLAGVLDGGGSARFASRLVRGKEVASSVGAGYPLTSRLNSVFSVSGTPARGKSVEELEQAIREELVDLQEKPISDKELERVKAQVVSSDVYEKDSVFYQAMILGILETVGLSWHLVDEYVERVQAVTAAQVQEVANKYFVDDHLTIAVLEPQPFDRSAGRPNSGGNPHAR
ncbi:MAG: insulinase family protein [Gammaproteobacteria bacterium]|nr:insulinase family protein [Gammaproteobacteria bacterium]